MNRYGTLALLAASGVLAGGAGAATITWGSVTGVTGTSSIANNGAAHSAVNSAGQAQVVNGVSFADGGGQASTWWTGEGGNSTGDAALDQVLDTHITSYGSPTHPSEYSFDITGLTIGQEYQLQIIGIHDARTCCNTRTYTLPDATGVAPTFNGPQLVRGVGGNDAGGTGSAAGTVIGTFTAGAATETVRISNVPAPGGNDPGISGYVVRQVPEPGSLALLGLGGLMIARRRRG